MPYKWSVWKKALDAFGIEDVAKSQMGVWRILILSDPSFFKNPRCAKVMSAFGLIWSVLWNAYWTCLRDENTWNANRCLARVWYRKYELSLDFTVAEPVSIHTPTPLGIEYIIDARMSLQGHYSASRVTECRFCWCVQCAGPYTDD